jgi:ABC-type glycerol-3-phosphate transport system substrate-binding protein
VTDHVSGVRGKSTKWALENFAQFRPNVDIKFTPQSGDFVEAFAIQLAAGTAPEAALLGWGFFGAHQESFTQINDVLDKHQDFNGDDLIFEPDSYTINYDVGYPFTDQWSGAAFGLPYQGNVSGHQYNIDLYDQMGIEQPSESWTYANEWLEAAKQGTDVDNDIWGTKYGGGGSPHEWTPIGWGHGGKQFISPDGTHTSVFDDGGGKGFQFIVDLIHEHKVSPPVGAQKELSGEFGDPFSAGKIAAQLGRGDAKGNTVTRIKDRFRWSLAPQPRGDVTGTAAVHRTNQGHYVLASAARRGNVEAVVDFLVWMAGPTMQARAATDRGFLPCRWDALESPENLAAPPEGQELLKTFVQGEFRTWQGYHPSWQEWLAWRGIVQKGTLGDVTADEAIEEAIAVGDRILAQGVDLLNERKAKWGSTA